MDYLISHYFANVAWFWVVVHEPTFLAEYDAFHQLLHDGRGLEVDPLWLGTLFLVLAHSANSIDYLPPGCDFSYEEITGMFSSYFEAGRAALDCGDCGSIARIRTVQVVALFGPLALNSGDPGRVDVLIPYVAATVRLCQQLRLDKLGSDPNRMPDLEDPALPSGTNSLRRELAIRAFQTVSHLDQMIFRCRPTLPVYLSKITSPRTSPVRPPTYRSSQSSAPCPAILTTATSVPTRSRRRLRRACARSLRTRNLLDEYDLERPEPNETTPQFWARIFALQNVNIRLIRFHRPCAIGAAPSSAPALGIRLILLFFSHVARVPRSDLSQVDRRCARCCPHGARDAEGARPDAMPARQRLVSCLSLLPNPTHIAVVVLFAQIWHEHIPETHVPTADYRLVTDASLCFHRALSSVRERVRNVARQSLLVVQCMFESLHAMSADQRKESFAQLLKRITAVVADAERRAASMNGHCVAAAEAPAPCIVPTPSAVPPPPSSGPVDARSLLLNVPTPVHAPSAGTPYFPKPPRSASDSSHAPHDLHFGDLTSSDWGFDWMTLPQL
ncbi:SPOSA6832_04531, partial [Sporobolomyces salmonicolor]